MARALLTMISAAALASCHPASRSSPEAAYRALVEAAKADHAGGEVDSLGRFDSSTRAALQARAEAASEATGKLLPADPAYQLLLGPDLAAPLTRVSVESADGGRAVLQVETDGGSGRVTLVDEKGWKVHLDL